MTCPRIEEPSGPGVDRFTLLAPLDVHDAARVSLEKEANIVSLPDLGSIPDSVSVPVLLKVGDDVSTDDITPAGARVMPYWSNIPKTSEFTFEAIDAGYVTRTLRDDGHRVPHAIVAGSNYGQGSSRENAALAPRYLGLEVVVAKGFARIHWQNLVNFGVLPLTFSDPGDHDRIEEGSLIEISDIRSALRGGAEIKATANDGRLPLMLRHDLSPRQIEVLSCRGVIAWMRGKVPEFTRPTV